MANETTSVTETPPAPAKRKPRKRAVQNILGTTVMLQDFLAEQDAAKFNCADRELIIEQALVLLEQLYVHLPLKRAMHAVDPIQRLKLLRRRIAVLSQVEFNREMLAIFTELRDLHTNYLLPEPFQRRTALLPFLLEEFFQDGTRQYMVSHVATGFRHTWFKAGVIVTHWNGTPIDRAVALNAEQQMGSNPEARHARGLEAMTIRPLMLTVPPDEEWVMVRYLAKDGPHEIQFRWRVLEPTPSPDSVDPNKSETLSAFALGYDALTETARRVKKFLFSPQALETEKRMAMLGADATKRDLKKNSTMPDVFSFRAVETPSGTFAYIRIWTFMVSDEAAFVNEFIRILEMLPQNGLLLDVRANGGGLIQAGERLLQVLTPRAIEPSRLHFINSPLTRELSTRVEWLSRWRESIEQAVETGSAFSYGFPLQSSSAYNSLGQKYHGPVVLIVDALCYSTTDIFAAGFQDHHIGKILGTTGNMGAGGANVWTHELLRELMPEDNSPFKKLPNGASFRVAIRRTTRVGEHSGVPLEGLGVIPDAVHRMTANDLLNQNEDLIRKAGEMLAACPVRELDAKLAGENGSLKITVNTKNIARLDVYVDERPQTSLDVDDGKTTLSVSTAAQTECIDLRAFAQNELVARKKITLHNV